jgi:hypothetical protein
LAISQIGLDTHLFKLDQDHMAIKQLLTLGTGLETIAKILIDVGKDPCEIDDKN